MPHKPPEYARKLRKRRPTLPKGLDGPFTSEFKATQPCQHKPCFLVMANPFIEVCCACGRGFYSGSLTDAGWLVAMHVIDGIEQ